VQQAKKRTHLISKTISDKGKEVATAPFPLDVSSATLVAASPSGSRLAIVRIEGDKKEEPFIEVCGGEGGIKGKEVATAPFPLDVSSVTCRSLSEWLAIVRIEGDKKEGPFIEVCVLSEKWGEGVGETEKKRTGATPFPPTSPQLVAASKFRTSYYLFSWRDLNEFRIYTNCITDLGFLSISAQRFLQGKRAWQHLCGW
jgi:hypothetical protein